MNWKSLLLLAALVLGHGAAAERLTWIINDFPPGHVISGERAGTGIFDIEIKYFVAHLPDFTHAIRVTANIRAWTLLKEQDGICIAGAVDTPERRQFALFNQLPALAVLAPRVLTRRDEASRFDRFRTEAGEIDLARLAADPSLRAARTVDRPLGQAIDQFSSTVGSHQLTNLPTSKLALMMLDKGHVDYAFGYVTELTYYHATHPGSAEMVAFPIAGQPHILYTRIACSDGPIGRRAIEGIDRLLGRVGLPPPYFAATARWYDPEDFRQLSSQAIWTR